MFPDPAGGTHCHRSWEGPPGVFLDSASGAPFPWMRGDTWGSFQAQLWVRQFDGEKAPRMFLSNWWNSLPQDVGRAV